jgi:hypothetical protein
MQFRRAASIAVSAREMIVMLWGSTSIRGYSVEATDGLSGTVEDFIFEDVGWTIRWLVVETGDWLSGRRVYVPVSAFGKPDPKERKIPLILTMDQIGQYQSGDASQLKDDATGAHFTQGEVAAGPVHHGQNHFRSLARLEGSAIEATDDEVGHAENFIIETDTWLVKYLVVHTSDWWPGEKLLVAVDTISGIDYTRNILKLDVTRQFVKDSLPFSPEQTEEGAYDESFLTYFGIRFVKK